MSRSKNLRIQNKKSLKDSIVQRDRRAFIRHYKGKWRKFYATHFSAMAHPRTELVCEDVELFGNSARISGFLEDDYNSMDMLLNDVEMHEPNVHVLGELSHAQMHHLKPQKEPPVCGPVRDEDVIARNVLSQFFLGEMPRSLKFYREDDEDFGIYEANRLLRRKIAWPELAVAHAMVHLADRKLFFGNANPLLLAEDLVLRLSLDELQEMFHTIVREYNAEINADPENHGMHIPPTSQPIDIINNMMTLTRELYHEELYGKKTLFTAAVVRRSMRLYKSTFATVDHLLVEPTARAVRDPGTPELTDIFHDDEFHFYCDRLHPEHDFEEVVHKLGLLS